MKLTDLVDRSQLQEIQDRLSAMTGLPMGIIDPDGNDITERSGLSHFCGLLLGTEKGLKKCIEATKENIATKPGKVNSYECYAGLWHLNTPIAIEDEVIGIIVIGNMLREKLGKRHVEQLAEEYGLDKGELWEASKDLRMYNEEEAENVVRLLATISSMLSKQASYAAKLREYSEQLEEKVEKKIQEVVHQKEMIENITRSIDEGILLLSKDFKILWANRKIMDMTGLEESDVIGDHCFRVTHHLEEPCKAPHDTCPVKEVIKTGKPVAKTHTHFDKDGNEFYAEVIAYPLRDEKGEITGFVHVARDITERKKMEEALRESEQKTRTTMDNIAMGVSMISPKMEIVWLNRTFKEWFPEIKVERKPLCYRSFYYPPKKGICDYCPTIKAFEDSQVHSSETDVCADGKIYFVTSAPVKNDEGETVYVIETVQDITERKRLEQQITETKDHL
ncbi:MAG: PocR ligand-binding domain-containing protein, partial [Candidatus Hydrothermarchaeales archaeon]